MWTTKTPTEPGWYWMRRCEHDDAPEVIEVYQRPGHDYLAYWSWAGDDHWAVAKTPDHLWIGPLEVPACPPIDVDLEVDESQQEHDNECQHNWIDARNTVITSGLYCTRCGAIQCKVTTGAGQ